ncbi:MAG: S41 family peptidase [bacterium]|nr:S41 family peptidase [bacterium]
MNSDSTKQPTPASETVSASEKTSKKFSWPLFCKQMLIACLLGMFLGLILSHPLHYAADKVEEHLTDRRERETYGRVLPEEMRTIEISYQLLRNNFYRAIDSQDLLNGALVSINIACENAQDKKAKKTEKPSDKKNGTQTKSTLNPSPSPSVSPASSATSSSNISPSPSPTPSRSAVQTYQEYAKLTAEALRTAKTKIIYPLLDAQDLSEDELLKQFTQTVLKAMDDGIISKDKICYSALCGMTIATADPYSTALDKDETRELNEDLGNEDFCGIGVYIEADMRSNKQLTVIEPIDGSPAAQAGLQTGDRITSIDGRPTKDMSLELAAKAIRGPEGSKVKLTIARSQSQEFTVEIERKKVGKKSVTSKMLPQTVGYVRLRYFGRDTGKDCREALLALLEKKPKAIVLDLRNNPGGSVEEAIIVASQFLPKDQLITSVETPRTGRHDVYKAIGEPIPPLPLAVLINEYSASASEIVAGAIKDHRRGVLVGETTFGKGSVQLLRKVGCDMSLKFTIAHYLTPNLRDIHMKGIEPDFICEAPFSNRLGDSDDQQLQAALKQLEQLKRDKQ